MSQYHVPAATRTATLVNRVRGNPVRRERWLVGWAIWLAGLLAILGRVVVPAADGASWWGVALPAEAALRTSWLVACGAQTVLGPVALLVGLWAVSRSLQEPEPMDSAGSPELAAAYTRHRTMRAWGFYYCTLIMVAVLGAGQAAIAWAPNSEALGLIGALVGSAVGVAGASFGVYAGVQRLRIHALYRKVMSDQ